MLFDLLDFQILYDKIPAIISKAAFSLLNVVLSNGTLLFDDCIK